MPLPSFIIIGERKCGTTTLHHVVNNHPEIYAYPKPDFNYFIENEIATSRKWMDGPPDSAGWEATHSVEEYGKLFEEGKSFKVSCHKGSDIFFWEPGVERMKRYTPDSKLIVVLRDPIKRAWSHYWNEVGKGRENLSFEKAIAAENERISKSGYAHFQLTYVSKGFYDESYEKLLKYFPKEQVLVLIIEDFPKDPTTFYKSICDFVGVSFKVFEDEPAAQKNQNFTMVKKKWVENDSFLNMLDNLWVSTTNFLIMSYTKDAEKRKDLRKKYHSLFRMQAIQTKMKETTLADLQKIYLPHIERLETLLGRELNDWKKGYVK